MKEQKAVQETQGVKKVQKASVSYALEALKKHIETISENYLLTEEEVAQMKEIATKAAMKFVKEKYGILCGG